MVVAAATGRARALVARLFPVAVAVVLVDARAGKEEDEGVGVLVVVVAPAAGVVDPLNPDQNESYVNTDDANGLLAFALTLPPAAFAEPVDDAVVFEADVVPTAMPPDPDAAPAPVLARGCDTTSARGRLGSRGAGAGCGCGCGWGDT